MSKQQTKNVCKNMIKSGAIKMMVSHTTLPAEFVQLVNTILNGDVRSDADITNLLTEYLGNDDAAERDLAAHLAGKAIDRYNKSKDVSICIRTLEAIAAFCPDITGHHTHCETCEAPINEYNVCIFCLAEGQAEDTSDGGLNSQEETPKLSKTIEQNNISKEA